MRVIRIQRLAMSGLPRHHILGTMPSISPRSSKAHTQSQTVGARSFWSGVRSFGKTLQELADMLKQRAESKPKVDDGVIHPGVELIKPDIPPEHPEMEKSVNFWTTCGPDTFILRLFITGFIKIKGKTDGTGYAVLRKPNKKSETYETHQDVPEPSLLAIAKTLEKAFKRGNNWAEIHFPREIANLLEDASWLAQPATEKQKEYIRDLYAPKGPEGSCQATELVIEGHRISINDVYKGKAGNLIQLAVYVQWSSK